MFALGGYFYYKYPHMVKTNAELYDRWDEDPIVTQLDKTWALETQEISRWTQASKLLMLSSGVQWASWLLNRSMDNAGGQQHELYLRMAQLGVYFWPAVLLLQFSRIYNAYNRTIAVDTAEYSVFCGNSKCT